MLSVEKIPADFAPSMTRGRRIGRWFFRRKGAHGRWRPRWSRWLVVVGALLGVGYVAGAVGLFGFLRYTRGVEAMRLTDMLWPARWKNIPVALGERQLVEARHYADRQMFREAFTFARAGLARAPGNRAGRLLLFELFLASKQPESARQTLLDGLRDHAADPGFLKTVLAFLHQQQDDARIIALARRYLPEAAPSSDAAWGLALGAATAGFLRGNYDQAEDFLRLVPRLADSREGRLLAARTEWERGYRELALVQLRRLAAEWPQDGEVHRELVRHLRQHALVDEARRASLGFQIAFPSLAGPRIELLYAYRLDGEAVRVAREAEALLRDFATDQRALLALADFAASMGDVALVRRIADQTGVREPTRSALAMLSVEAMVVARDYSGAREEIRRYRAEFPALPPDQAGVFDSLQAAALFGAGEGGAAALYFKSFLGQSNLRAANLLAVANRFAELGAGEHARQTLTRAIELDPLNQAALTRLVELDIIHHAGEDLAAHVQRLVHMRQPSQDVLRVAQLKLGSDLFLFSPECPVALETVRVALERMRANQRAAR